jgi:hypothetical protein
MNWTRVGEIVTAIIVAEMILMVARTIAQRYQEQPQTANASGHTSQGTHDAHYGGILSTATGF